MKSSKLKVRQEIIYQNYKTTWEVLGLLSKAPVGTCMEQRQKEAALFSAIFRCCGQACLQVCSSALPFIFAIIVADVVGMDNDVTEYFLCPTYIEQHSCLVLIMVHCGKLSDTGKLIHFPLFFLPVSQKEMQQKQQRYAHICKNQRINKILF